MSSIQDMKKLLEMRAFVKQMKAKGLGRRSVIRATEKKFKIKLT